MDFKDAIVYFQNLDPENFVFALSEAFRAKSYDIIERKRLDFYYVATPTSEKCWEAEHEIFQREFAAYQKNDFDTYKSIDRETPFSSRGITNKCKIFEMVKSRDADSWFLKVEIPQGNYSTNITKPDINTFFLFNGSFPMNAYAIGNKTQTINTSFSSMLYIWAWKIPKTTKTEVYLEAKPVNGQIVAHPGCSIGYSWWKQANGYAEYKLVKNYVLLLKELKQSDNILQKINKTNKHDGV